MADNYVITEGSGRTMAADDIGTILFPRVKLIYGPDGTNSGDVSAANPLPIQVTDGTNIASVRNTGSSDSLNVAIVDASGNQITTFGGGTEYTEDAASASDPVGNVPIYRRRDTLSGSEVSADGDNIAAVATAKGELYVKHADTIAVTSSGTFTVRDDSSLVDDAAFSPATSRVVMFGAQLDNTSPDSVDEGDAGALRMSANRNLFTNIRSGDGSERSAVVLDTGSNDSLAVAIVDASGTQITSFGGGTQYTEDAAAASDPVGTVPILIRKDTPATTVSTDGDNIAQRGTNYGAAYVQVVTSSGSYVDTFGGGAQYTEGDTDSSITGTAILWEDAGDTLVPISTSKPLPVSLISLGSVVFSVAGALTDSDSYTPESTTLFQIGAAFDDSSPDSVDEGQLGILRMSANRNLYGTIRDAAGNERGANVDSSNRLTVAVGNSVAVTNADITSIAGAIMAEDAAISSGDPGIRILAQRADTEGNTAGTDGDASMLHMFDGRLSVSLRDRSLSQTITTTSTSNAIQIDCDGMDTVSAQVTATATGTLTFEGSVDGTNYQTMDNSRTLGGGAATLNVAGTATRIVSCAGYRYARLRVTSTGSGTATVLMLAKKSGLLFPMSDVGTSSPNHAEDAGHLSGDYGTFVLARRVDSPASSSGSSADYSAFNVDANGRLYVNSVLYDTTNASCMDDTNHAIKSNLVASAAMVVDDAAFTPATTSVLMMGAEFDNTSPDSVDEGDAGALRMSANRNLFINIRDAAGNERGLNVNAAGQIGVSLDATGLASSTIGKVKLQDGGGNDLTSVNVGSSQAIDVALRDSSGNQIDTFGGGTEYTEGDTDASITGSAILWEDGSDTLRAVSAAKPLPVTIISGGSSNFVTNGDDLDMTSTGSHVDLSCSGFSKGVLQVTTWGSGGNIAMFGSADGGTTYRQISPVLDQSNSQGELDVIDQVGNYCFPTGGLTDIRVKVNATGTGSTAVVLNASSGEYPGIYTRIQGSVSVDGSAISLIEEQDDSGGGGGSGKMIPVGGTYQSSRPTLTNGQYSTPCMTAKAALLSVLETPNGDSVCDDTADAVKVRCVPGTTVGEDMFEYLNLGNTGQVVKNAAGLLYGYYLWNIGAAPAYVKVYDKATAASSSDTPKLRLMIPAGGAANLDGSNGKTFSSGISVRATTGVADADTSSPGSNEVGVNIFYK